MAVVAVFCIFLLCVQYCSVKLRDRENGLGVRERERERERRRSEDLCFAENVGCVDVCLERSQDEVMG